MATAASWSTGGSRAPSSPWRRNGRHGRPPPGARGGRPGGRAECHGSRWKTRRSRRERMAEIENSRTLPPSTWTTYVTASVRGADIASVFLGCPRSPSTPNGRPGASWSCHPGNCTTLARPAALDADLDLLQAAGSSRPRPLADVRIRPLAYMAWAKYAWQRPSTSGAEHDNLEEDDRCEPWHT